MYLYFILVVVFFFKILNRKESFDLEKCKELYIEEPELSDPYNTENDYSIEYNKYKEKLKYYSDDLIKYCFIK